MKRNISMLFMLLSLLFCVFLVLANLMEVKVIEIGGFTATAGLLVFPVSYIINDCIVEVYGFRKARFVIWLGFIMNLIFVLFLQLCIVLPSSPSWPHQDAVETVFGNTTRILCASFIAFICGSMVNAYVMSKMKVMNGGNYFSLRAVLSTLFGEGVDSIILSSGISGHSTAEHHCGSHMDPGNSKDNLRDNHSSGNHQSGEIHQEERGPRHI